MPQAKKTKSAPTVSSKLRNQSKKLSSPRKASEAPEKKKAAAKKKYSASHIKSNSSPARASKAKFTLDKLVTTVSNVFSSKPSSISDAIKEDHDNLRNFIKILKDTDREMSERKSAYLQFASLLKSHAQAEELAVYEIAKMMTGRELHIKTAEGYVEHQVANDLLARIAKATDPIEWSAHTNVLAESIEHHLDEEERDLLPVIHRQTSSELDLEMLELYLKVRKKTQPKLVRKTPEYLSNPSLIRISHSIPFFAGSRPEDSLIHRLICVWIRRLHSFILLKSSHKNLLVDESKKNGRQPRHDTT